MHDWLQEGRDRFAPPTPHPLRVAYLAPGALLTTRLTTAARPFPLQECLGVPLPPGDLPAVLQDGRILCTLAARLPTFDAPRSDATAAECIDAFAGACRHLGIEPGRVLHPDQLLLPGPRRSAVGLVQALTALAHSASVRGLLPALRH